MTGHACAYVSASRGIHDDRWLDALRRLGYQPTAIVVADRDTSSVHEQVVVGLAGSTAPVLAGPLDSVTRHLVGIEQPLVGLSWGYDLHRMVESGADLSWLSELDGLIVDSLSTRAIAMNAGLPAECITVLPWGVDLTLFTPEGVTQPPAGLGVAEGRRMLISLRAHEDLYRVGDIIEGFALMASQADDLDLVIGHSGSLTQGLRQRVGELGLGQRVHFIGSVPEPELPPLLRAAAAYITAAEVDGTSVTLLQAMACGTPVVASDSAGNLEWVTEAVTGRTFATGDPRSLADAIERTLQADPAPLVAEALSRVRARADWWANISRLGAAMKSVTR